MYIGLVMTLHMLLKAYDSDKLIDTKQKLTEHWNEAHIAITERLRSVAEGHKQS